MFFYPYTHATQLISLPLKTVHADVSNTNDSLDGAAVNYCFMDLGHAMRSLNGTNSFSGSFTLLGIVQNDGISIGRHYMVR